MTAQQQTEYKSSHYARGGRKGDCQISIICDEIDDWLNFETTKTKVIARQNKAMARKNERTAIEYAERLEAGGLVKVEHRPVASGVITVIHRRVDSNT